MSSSIDSNYLVMNTNQRQESASVCSTRFVEGSIVILYRWQSPEWSRFFFSNGQRPKRVRQTERERERAEEKLNTFIHICREWERELLRNHPRRMIDSRVFTTYILHKIVHIYNSQNEASTDTWVEWVSERRWTTYSKLQLEPLIVCMIVWRQYIHVHRWEMAMNSSR